MAEGRARRRSLPRIAGTDVWYGAPTTPLEWLRLAIDRHANAPQSPDAFGPFRWERIIP